MMAAEPRSARSSFQSGAGMSSRAMRAAMAKGGPYALQVVQAGSLAGSSLRDGSRSKGSHRSKLKTKVVRSLKEATHITFMPEAHKEEENGWQMKCEDVKSRIATLFNCYTMSDVVFQIEVYSIPAHKFILSSASPVFYKQLYEDDHSHTLGLMQMQRTGSFLSESGMSAHSFLEPSHRQIKIAINDVPHLAFFEFLQFIYTDNVNINLENVLMLVILADHYKVAGLSDRCFEFIRLEVVPHAVLRVLTILRELLLKAIVSLWKDLVEQRKSLIRFRQLTLAERRAKIEEMEGASSLASSRRGSVCSRRSWSGRSRCSMRSDRSSVSRMYGLSKTDGMYRDSSEEDFDDDNSDVQDMAVGFSKKKKMQFDTGFKGSMMKIKIAGFVEELNQRCWKCIQEETGSVITSSHMWDQDVSMLRRILRLDTASVPEIMMFRCANEWAERCCVKAGLPVNSETKREMLGQETLHLIRFPCMSLDQFQWEVVPTGLLPYEDVQQLLSTMTQRTPGALHQYNSKPRQKIRLRANTRSLSPVGNEGIDDGRPIYNAVDGDPLDTMLGAELLRSFLKETTVDQDIFKNSAVGEGRPDTSLSSRLPPISPRATPGGISINAPLVDSGKPRRPRRTAAEMVMGSRIDEEEQDGIVVQGGGRRPQPHDFVRLCHGLYKFREDRVVELWLNEGEAMVHDHGFNSALFTYHEFEDEPNPKTVRARLHLSELTYPERNGNARGVPLASFLQRQ